MKVALLVLLSALMTLGGVMHFVKPDMYVQMMPAFLPAHLALVYLSGVFEIVGGVGLLIPQTRRWAAWGVVALLVAVFPANVNVAINDIAIEGLITETWMMWARLPFQGVLVAWAGWFTRPWR